MAKTNNKQQQQKQMGVEEADFHNVNKTGNAAMLPRLLMLVILHKRIHRLLLHSDQNVKQSSCKYVVILIIGYFSPPVSTKIVSNVKTSPNTASLHRLSRWRVVIDHRPAIFVQVRVRGIAKKMFGRRSFNIRNLSVHNCHASVEYWLFQKISDLHRTSKQALSSRNSH